MFLIRKPIERGMCTFVSFSNKDIVRVKDVDPGHIHIEFRRSYSAAHILNIKDKGISAQNILNMLINEYDDKNMYLIEVDNFTL